MGTFVATGQVRFGVVIEGFMTQLSLWDNNQSVGQFYPVGGTNNGVKDNFGGGRFANDYPEGFTADKPAYVSGGAITQWWHYEQQDLRIYSQDLNIPIPYRMQVTAESMLNLALGGDDSIVGSALDDQLGGRGGADTVMAGAGNDTIYGGDAGATFNVLRGEDGNDSIQGGDGFDDTHGNKGDDTIHGGLGNDWVVGGQGSDLLYGDQGFDVVLGNMGEDTLFGGDGVDWVRGGQGNDIVDGGAGDDLVYGDRGSDTLTGGSGADQFRILAEGGTDRITDFNGTEGDRIAWEGTARPFTVNVAGNDTHVSFGAGDVFVLANVTSFDNGWVIYV